MIRLSRPHYESDATRFIQRLKALSRWINRVASDS